MASHSSFSFSIKEHQPSVYLDLYNISLFKFSQFFVNLKFCIRHLFCGYHYGVTFSHEANSNDRPENRLRVGFVASVDFVMIARDSRIISLKLAVFCVFNDPSYVTLQNFTCLYAAMLLNIRNTPVQSLWMPELSYLHNSWFPVLQKQEEIASLEESGTGTLDFFFFLKHTNMWLEPNSALAQTPLLVSN